MIGSELAAVRARIAAACARAGRDPASVTLVAVTKTMPDDAVRAAWAAGARDFGENYAQALRDRSRSLGDLAGVRWHMIGALQKNKARYVAAHAAAFHALDDRDVARELGRRAAALGRTVDCLVEVNLGGEAQKAGVRPAEVEALVKDCQGIPGIRLAGLMCIPPAEQDPRPLFRALLELRQALAARGLPLPELSMGMSADFEAAIEEGATMVRVGTAIFGERNRGHERKA